MPAPLWRFSGTKGKIHSTAVAVVRNERVKGSLLHVFFCLGQRYLYRQLVKFGIWFRDTPTTCFCGLLFESRVARISHPDHRFYLDANLVFPNLIAGFVSDVVNG